MVLKITVEIGGGAQECFSKEKILGEELLLEDENVDDQQADLLEGQHAEAERGEILVLFYLDL